MSGGLKLLLRLEQRRLDEVRQALAAETARLDALESELEALRGERREELSRPVDRAPEAGLIARYHAGSRRREAALLAKKAALEQTCAERLEQLTERRLEARRLELLLERQELRQREELARRERRELDELVLARAARRR